MQKNKNKREIDYQKVGLKVGLELHQQLDTKAKLFCNCPTKLREDPADLELLRELRPTQSELGQIDRAALFEFQKNLKFLYEGYDDTVCLVEQDEEPPHKLDEEALRVTLTMTCLLQSNIIDEIHVMRKIVIDGSNTGGFQRTCIVGLGGFVEDPRFGRVGIQTIALEEDAARKLDTDKKMGLIRYRLDRLGVPLIEIATAPDIHDPEMGRVVAEKIGLLLRSTRRVKRGQGTIRQDLNISIRDGGLTEVKGVQRLDLIERIIEYEVERQINLLEIKKELEKRGAKPSLFEGKPTDVTDVFLESKSKILQLEIQKKARIMAQVFPKMAGIIGVQLQPGRRLGTELADYARAYGRVSGLFHTDELPNYGITKSDLVRLHKKMKKQNGDAIIIIAGKADNVEKAFLAVQQRVRQLFKGVPSETRAANEDGTTKYMRPRPGSARMYPETDVAPTIVSKALLKEIVNSLPESLEVKRHRFIQEYKLSKQVASQMVNSLQLDLFEDIMERYRVPASIVAATLLETWKSLRREGIPMDELTSESVLSVFEGLSDQKFAKEAIPDLLSFLARHPDKTINNAITELRLESIDLSVVESFIESLVKKNADLIHKRKLNAIGPLMGDAMREFQGKVDGKIVNKILVAAIKARLASK
ncbi:MAG: Glu-tRNA(Gln) amidotransferase subunit GatE [Candidatus Ranarchaeia archaeon]